MMFDADFLGMAKKSVEKPAADSAAPAPVPVPAPATGAVPLATKSPAKAVVDAVFMMDCTGSMGSFIAQAKETIKKMITDIKEHYSESSIFVGFIAYRDHCDGTVLETKGLTGDVEDVYHFIEKLNASGGGDTAEAVADGLNFAANKIEWRNEDALRLLIHVCDAPPHGKEFCCSSDDYPAGCPCGVDYKACLKKLGEMKVQYLVLNFTQEVATMIKIFKMYHDDVESMDMAPSAAVHSYSGEKAACCDKKYEEARSDSDEAECDEDMTKKDCEEKPKMKKKAAAPHMSMKCEEAPASKMKDMVSASIMSKAKSKWG